jgi:hypothetical protein
MAEPIITETVLEIAKQNNIVLQREFGASAATAG